MGRSVRLSGSRLALAIVVVIAGGFATSAVIDRVCGTKILPEFREQVCSSANYARDQLKLWTCMALGIEKPTFLGSSGGGLEVTCRIHRDGWWTTRKVEGLVKHDDLNELRGARIYAGRDLNGDKVISKNEWTLMESLTGLGSPVSGTLAFPVFEGENDVLAYRIVVECVHSNPTYCQWGNMDLLCEDPPSEAGDGVQTSAGLR